MWLETCIQCCHCRHSMGIILLWQTHFVTINLRTRCYGTLEVNSFFRLFLSCNDNIHSVNYSLCIQIICLYFLRTVHNIQYKQNFALVIKLINIIHHTILPCKWILMQFQIKGELVIFNISEAFVQKQFIFQIDDFTSNSPKFTFDTA